MPQNPNCPKCGRPMTLRRTTRAPHPPTTDTCSNVCTVKSPTRRKTASSPRVRAVIDAAGSGPGSRVTSALVAVGEMVAPNLAHGERNIRALGNIDDHEQYPVASPSYSRALGRAVPGACRFWSSRRHELCDARRLRSRQGRPPSPSGSRPSGSRPRGSALAAQCEATRTSASCRLSRHGREAPHAAGLAASHRRG